MCIKLIARAYCLLDSPLTAGYLGGTQRGRAMGWCGQFHQFAFSFKQIKIRDLLSNYLGKTNLQNCRLRNLQNRQNLQNLRKSLFLLQLPLANVIITINYNIDRSTVHCALFSLKIIKIEHLPSLAVIL